MRLRPFCIQKFAPRAATRGGAVVAAFALMGLAAPARRAPHSAALDHGRDTLSLTSGVTLAIIPGSSTSVTVYPGGPVGGAPQLLFELSRSVHPGRSACEYIVGASITETSGAVVAHKDLPSNCNVAASSAALSVQPLSSAGLLAACSGKFTQPATSLTVAHVYVAELLGTYQGSAPSPLAQHNVTVTSHITCAPGPYVQAVKSITVVDTLVQRIGGFCPAQLAFDGVIDANMAAMANSVLAARWNGVDTVTYPAPITVSGGSYRTHLVLTLPNGAHGTMRLRTLTPNAVSSAPVSYQVQCNPPPTTIVVAAPKGGIPSPVAKPVASTPVKRPPPPPNTPHP